VIKFIKNLFGFNRIERLENSNFYNDQFLAEQIKKRVSIETKVSDWGLRYLPYVDGEWIGSTFGFSSNAEKSAIGHLKDKLIPTRSEKSNE